MQRPPRTIKAGDLPPSPLPRPEPYGAPFRRAVRAPERRLRRERSPGRARPASVPPPSREAPGVGPGGPDRRTHHRPSNDKSIALDHRRLAVFDGLRGACPATRSAGGGSGREMRTLAPPLVAGLVRVLGPTLRVTLSGVASLVPLWYSKRPLIYVMWHGRILMAPWLNERLRASHGARAPRMLVSLSRNGGLMARLAGRFGLDVVRGSSSGSASSRAGAGGRPRAR